MRRAFTVIELFVVILVAIVLAAVFLPAIGRPSINSRQLKDSTQVRGILQSMVVWANNNNGDYPLPSEIDKADLTVKDPGRAKDTTANIFSILIFNGNISPELCVSPAESNTTSIQRDEDYQYNDPKAAISPASALWDPAFAADFTSAKGGNFSYGHLQPSGSRATLASSNAAAAEPTGRLYAWADTFSTTEAVLANRGPEITSVASDYTPTLKNKSSNTLLIHGGRSTWEGNVGYNDGHVAFEVTLKPLSPAGMPMSYATASGQRNDVIFFDEPDDTNQSNIFLGIFTTAGEKPADFQGIWD